MTSANGGDLGAWQARALAAEKRADAETRRAVRAQGLAEHGHERSRELHQRIAELHRLSADRHRTTASLYRSMLRQLAGRRAPVGIGRLLVDTLQDLSRSPSVAILLLGQDGSTLESLSTDPLAAAAQDLEFVHGEGPLHTACASREPVVATGSGLSESWPAYSRVTHDLGLATVVAAPLLADYSSIGAVGLFNPPRSAAPGESLLQLATGIARILNECAHDPEQSERLLSIDGMRTIHQAAGVVSAEAGCAVDDALALIRARSFASDQPAEVVALQVLEGDLHLGP